MDFDFLMMFFHKFSVSCAASCFTGGVSAVSKV